MSQLLVQDSQTLRSPEPVEQDSQTVCGGTQNNQSMNETGIDDHSEEVIGGEHAEASPDIDQYRSSELKKNLRRHKLIVHKVWENNNVVCDVKTCPFTTRNIAQLRRHKTMNHTRKHIFECNQCEQKFLSVSGLQKHVRSDHRFQCKNCLQTFSMEKQLRQHNRVVHNAAHEGVRSDEQAAVVVSRVIGEHATHKIYTGTQVSTDV